MYRVRPLFVGGLVTLCLPVFAADELISFQSFNGYTGLINTPTAEVLATGTVDIGHNNQLDFKGNKYVDGHNFIFGAGLFDGLEASGQIAASSMNDNMYYSQGRGQLRDLSFNLKYQIPFIPHDWLLFYLFDVDGHVVFEFEGIYPSLDALDFEASEERLSDDFRCTYARFNPFGDKTRFEFPFVLKARDFGDHF